MAIITFASSEIKETGQTLSLAAVATQMAISHNYKILIVPTSFNDISLENCFWEYDKIRVAGAIKADEKGIGIETGIEGLIKVFASNRTSNEIVKNYSKIVLRDRLDVLLSPITKSYQEYAVITQNYKNILSVANKYYDFVFVDLNKRMPKQDMSDILQMSDIVVVNLTQKLKNLDNFAKLRDSNDFYKRKNVMISIGRYDKASKYNKKNITRYLREKKEVLAIPYNALFLDTCSEGKIIDYFLKIKNVNDELDDSVNFVREVEKTANEITYRLEEIQMKM